MGGKNLREEEAVKHSRIKTVPDAVFDRLWTDAACYADKNAYIDAYTNPAYASYINFTKYGISTLEAYDMLKEIHRYANMDIREIIDLTGQGKARLSHVFCIPKRTIENWYYGKRECAGYFKLMLLRQYHLLRLGKYIMVESDRTFLETVPGVYEKHEPPEQELPGTLPKKAERPAGNQKSWNPGGTPARTGSMDTRGTGSAYRSLDDLLKDTDYLSRLMKKKS